MHGRGGGMACMAEGGCAWQGYAWQGVCVAGGGMHGRGACVAGVCVWQGGMHGKGGMHGRGHAWQILQDTVNEQAVHILP